MKHATFYSRIFQFVKNHPYFSLLFLIAAALRFYIPTATQNFALDEARDSYAIWYLFQGHFPLLGPTSSLGNIHLGPFYYYLMAPALWLANFNPLGMTYFTIVLSLVTIGFLYFFSQKIFNKTTTLLITSLYAFSAPILNHARFAWQPNILPLFALLLFYCLWQLLQNKNFKVLPWIGLLLGICLQLHYSSIFIIPAIAVVLWLAIKKDKKLYKLLKPGLQSLGLFLLVLSSFIYSELINGLPNIQLLLQFSGTTVSLGMQGFAGHLFRVFSQSLAGLLGFTQTNWLSSLVSAGLLILAAKSSKTKIWYLSVFYYLFGVLGLSLLPKTAQHYFSFMYFLPFLLIGLVVDCYFKKVKSIYVLSIVVGFIFLQWPAYNFLKPLTWQIQDFKNLAWEIDMQSSGQKYNLISIKPDGEYMALPYRYFFDIANTQVAPANDYDHLDAIYVISNSLEKPDQILATLAKQIDWPSRYIKTLKLKNQDYMYIFTL